MTDLKLYTKLSALPLRQKAQVAEFIDSLNPHSRSSKLPNRKAGKANGLIEMKENFDDPIPGFEILMNSKLDFHHHDPFDRILIAQSFEENLTVVTKDEKFRTTMQHRSGNSTK